MNSETKPLWKRLITIGLPVIGGVVLMQSGYSLFTLVRRGDVVEVERKKLTTMEQEQAQLKKELSSSYTTSFIEQEARNKLGLVKPGETLVYIEQESTTAGTKSIESLQQKMEEKTILQQWWDVFF